MNHIHSQAIIEVGAVVDPNVSVGPFSIIESGAVIGAGCVIESNVRIHSTVRMGNNNHVYHGAVLGGEPNDLGYTPKKSRPLVIGNDNHFKENVNISCGTKTEHGTIIGNHNYFMNGFHAGHDCIFGNHNVCGPNSVIGGHVELGHNVFVSGLVAIHQFVRIGNNVMLAGCAKIVKDVPPYTTADGNPARIIGLNIVGLRRAGFDAATRRAIKQVYQTLYHAGLNTSQALTALGSQELIDTALAIKSFFETSQRGVTDHR